MDPCRASGRTGREAVSSNCRLGNGRRRLAYFANVVRGLAAAAAAAGVGGAEVMVRDKGRGPRLRVDRQPYRLAHRTPVLYSRNQSRTNIAL